MSEWSEVGLSEEEYRRVTGILGRRPNSLELGLFGVMWSEHCSYKNSRPLLRRLPTAGDRVVQGPGENAGAVRVDDRHVIVFKVESHNHPSAVEPYQGAATGVGGILRDIFTMGARPIAILDSLRFGEPDHPRVRHLLAGVVAGIGGYGNSMGVPTVGGETYFEAPYGENPLVNAMCVGIADGAELARGLAGGVGNPVLVVGARTGRDGIHGASFASEQLSIHSEERRPSVQVGDPFREKVLLEATLELLQTGTVVGIQDLGAAGLTSSSCETASRAGTGIELDVLQVPRREQGMTPYEVMLSESQERMLVILQAGHEAEARRIFAKWDLEAATIGRVTGDGILRIREGERIVAEVPARALAHDAPTYEREGREPAHLREARAFDPAVLPVPADLGEVLRRLLASPNLASKEWVYRQYDHMVRLNTVIFPGADAAVLRLWGTRRGIALAIDGNGRHGHLDPRTGGAAAVAEAARNVACVGAEPVAVTNCLNFGNPEKPEIYWQLSEAVDGLAEACRALETPVTGGNVSLYNEYEGTAIYPTPVVGMVGILEDVERRCTPGFKAPGDLVALLGETGPELGGSEYLKVIHGRVAGRLPPLDLRRERAVQEVCWRGIREGLVRAAHDCSDGGLAVALCEMAFAAEGQAAGCRIVLDAPLLSAAGRLDAALFAESYSRIVVEVAPENLPALRKLAAGHGAPLRVLGEVGGDRVVLHAAGHPGALVDLGTAELRRTWREAIPCLME